MESDHVVLDTESAPQTPGPILRKCREFNGISIEDAADATKIGRNYLRALEEDRHRDFASPAYLRGFLRTYATYLGLHPEDLLKLLEPEQPEATADTPHTQEQLSEGGRVTWQRLVLPATLLTVIIVVALLMRPSEQPAGRPVPPPPGPVPVNAIQPPHSSAQQQQAAPPPTGDAASIVPPTPPQTGVTLRIKATGKGNLVVTMDGATTQSYDLTAGDLIEWRAERVINLELSDPGSVELVVNGKPYKSALQPGSAATLTIDAKGVNP